MPQAAVEITAEPTPWLTVPEGARRAKCGVHSIYTAIRSGKLKATKVGLKLLVHVEWLDAWLDRGATVINPEAPGPSIKWTRRQ